MKAAKTNITVVAQEAAHLVSLMAVVNMECLSFTSLIFNNRSADQARETLAVR